MATIQWRPAVNALTTPSSYKMLFVPRNVVGTEELAALVASGDASGTFSSDNTADGVRRTSAYRRLADSLPGYAWIISLAQGQPRLPIIAEDLGMFTWEDEIGADATDLFNYLTGYSNKKEYRKLLVAPVNMGGKLEALIRRDQTRDAGNLAEMAARLAADDTSRAEAMPRSSW